jgi:hypothetical protein
LQHTDASTEVGSVREPSWVVSKSEGCWIRAALRRMEGAGLIGAFDGLAVIVRGTS